MNYNGDVKSMSFSKTFTPNKFIDFIIFIFLLLQLSMSVLANISNLSSGMGLGFPAITFQTLTNQTDPMALTNDQASWFGKLRSIKKKTLQTAHKPVIPF